MQTSISAWLKKPASVKEPPLSTSVKLPAQSTTINESGPATTAPTPTVDAAALQKNEDGQTEEEQSLLTSTLSKDPATSPSANKRPLVPNIRLEPCTPTTIKAFARLNTLLLPIPYPQKFYDEILSSATASSITLLAIWYDVPPPPPPPPSTATIITTTTNLSPPPTAAATPGRVIGGIRCRLLPPNGPDLPKKKMLYISTLCVLSPYRSYGIATHLLAAVLRTAIEEHDIKDVGAHVWEASTEAREWYVKRGFREEGREVGYYRRLRPQDAFVLRREVGVRDLLVVGGW